MDFLNLNPEFKIGVTVYDKIYDIRYTVHTVPLARSGKIKWFSI